MSRGHGQVLRPTKHPTRTPKSVADLALSACFHFCFQCGGKSGCTVDLFAVPGRCRLMAPPTLTGEHPSMGWRNTVAQSNVCVCVSSCGFLGVQCGYRANSRCSKSFKRLPLIYLGVLVPSTCRHSDHSRSSSQKHINPRMSTTSC